MPLDSGDGVTAEATSWSSCYCSRGSVFPDPVGIDYQ